jgi:hypothetical protein
LASKYSSLAGHKASGGSHFNKRQGCSIQVLVRAMNDLERERFLSASHVIIKFDQVPPESFVCEIT